MKLSKDSQRYLRHELRTYLNQITGLVEILHADLKDLDAPQFASDIEQLFQESTSLHDLFQQAFYEGGKINEDFDPLSFKRNLFGPLYIVIGLANRLKKRCEDEAADFLLSDVLKVLDAARKVLDLVDTEIKGQEGDPQPPSSPGDTFRPDFSQMSRTADVVFQETGTGIILVVDDNEMNRELLSRHLERQGHRVTTVDSGAKAFQLLKTQSFDLILLDIMMPVLNGYQVLEKLKADANFREIPVIMISALDEMDSVAHCIAGGAEDYLPKSFDPVLLKARISACLAKKHYRDKEQEYIRKLEEGSRTLEKELGEAAEYVTGLLPRPMTQPLTADWIFKPSAKLGGDCFDYHWLDEENLVIYLLDVSGHGIGAALLSVSVMNVLRSQGLAHADFHNPAEVLGALNQSFQMEHQNNMYFTIWYGVYNLKTREIRYGSAGAPPALLLTKLPTGQPDIMELTTTDMIIGVDMDYQYETRTCTVRPGSRLYLFSDGVYEVKKSSGKMLVFKEFMDILAFQPEDSSSHVRAIFNQIQGLAGVTHFEDDFSILEIGF